MGRGSSKASGGNSGKLLAIEKFGKESIGTNDVRITKKLNSDSAKDNPDFRLANEARAAGLGNNYGTYDVLANDRNGEGDVRKRQEGILYKLGSRTYGISGGFEDDEFDEDWRVTDLKTGMMVGSGKSLYRAKDAILLFNDRTAHENIRKMVKTGEERFNNAKKRKGKMERV